MYALFKPELLKLARDVYKQHALFESDGISAEELRRIQLERLKNILSHVKAHSPFYREKMSVIPDRNIDTLDWNSFRKLPYTTKDDLREAGHNIAAAPLKNAWIYYETTGTTGAATPCPRNEHDSIFNNTPLILRYSALFRQHTGVEIVPVTQIDHYVLQDSGVGEISAAVRGLYLETVKGLNSKYAHWLSPVSN